MNQNDKEINEYLNIFYKIFLINFFYDKFIKITIKNAK